MTGRRALGFIVAVALLGACGTTASRPASGHRLRVVVGENFWGSITEQLAGDRADVASIITNPATDPHDYEATPNDARAVATADYVIENGIGYDTWLQKLLDAQPNDTRAVLDVGRLVGVKVGGNPHQWYSPASVERFADRVTADLQRLDPADAKTFADRRTQFETNALASYHALIAQIRATYAATPVGASESIFLPLSDALGLRMLTPVSYLDAVAEGAEPTAHDTAVVNSQITHKDIKVFVFNRQNATPDVQRLVDRARAEGIPVATVTETLEPEGASFQAWQVAQLRDLRDALARASAG